MGGARPASPSPLKPNKAHILLPRIPVTPRYSEKYPNHSEPFRCPNIVVQYRPCIGHGAPLLCLPGAMYTQVLWHTNGARQRDVPLVFLNFEGGKIVVAHRLTP